MEIQKEPARTRNEGVDALRLLAMFGVVVLHIAGEIFVSTQGARHAAAGLLETLTYCAVDCYAMISGYVGYTEKKRGLRLSKYAKMWLQVAFYSVGLTLIGMLIPGHEVGRGMLIRSLFPVATGQYWYFCAYSGVFFMMPYLNALVRALDEREMCGLLLTVFGLFSCYATLAARYKDMFVLDQGYSFAWLTLLYLVGACMKRKGAAEKMSVGKLLAVFAGCVLVMWGVGVLLLPVRDAAILISYISPLVVMAAAALVICFAKLQIGPNMRGLVRSFAPAAFGVYLIHEHGVIFERLKAYCGKLAQISAVWTIPAILGSAAAVFVICLLAEKLRLILFEKLGVNDVVDRVFSKGG